VGLGVSASASVVRLTQSRWTFSLVSVVLVASSLAAFHRTLWSPFVFDDGLAVRDNPTIRSLSDWRAVLSPPNNGSGVSGRPVVNLSLALNHALSGLEPFGYHLTNILLHGVAGILLYACLLRVLPRCGVGNAGSVSLWVALIWVVHPLQSESVASVIQRTEILAGIFLLSTILCVLRGASSQRPLPWYISAAALSAIGMATKEIMFVAPILVLLFDRSILSGSFPAAWRQRRMLHVSLFAGWLILGVLVAGMGGTRGDAAGFGTGTISWWAYFLKQWQAIVIYLRLCLWPHPLIADYGTDVVTDWVSVLPQGLFLTGLAALTCHALRRNSPWALAGAWFFLILGPSSSVMPLAAQTMAEHRMYLPLAAVIVLIVVTVQRFQPRWGHFGLGLVAFALGVVSHARSRVYESELTLWSDTVMHRPGNERAHHNLAGVLNNMGRHEEALRHFQRAIEIEPRYLPPRIGVANCHFRAGRFREAIQQYESALAVNPNSLEALGNLGVILCELGQLDAGLRLLRKALELDPAFADVHFNLGTVLLKSGQLADAERAYREAIRLRPHHAEASNNLGAVLLRQGRRAEAETAFRRALELRPDYPEARANLQVVLAGGF